MVTAAEYSIPDGIMAMANDEGTVVTLLKRDPESGAVFRNNKAWAPLVDPSTIDGLNFVGVEDDAVDLYDQHESEGHLIGVRNYTPSLDGPFWPEVSTDDGLVEDEETGEYLRPDEEEFTEPVTDEEPLAASIIRLGHADDLESAIAAAMVDPNLRWYVERRVEVLGLEASLPWLEG